MALRDRIVTLIKPLIDQPTPLPTKAEASANADASSTLLNYVLSYAGLDLEARLGVLEVLCLGEFVAGMPGGVDIEFFSLSAAAETPWAADFEALFEKSAWIDRNGSGKKGLRDGWITSPDFLRPNVKLAGNELANFSAFFDPSWRKNDWMWGRLDAASGLVDVLLSEYKAEHPEAVRQLVESPGTVADVRRKLIAKRQAQILEEELGTDWRTMIRSHRSGLDTLNRPGSAKLRRSAVGMAAVAPKVLRGLLPSRLLRAITSPLGPIVRMIVWQLTRPNPVTRGRIPEALRRVKAAGAKVWPRPRRRR